MASFAARIAADICTAFKGAAIVSLLPDVFIDPAEATIAVSE
jgi:hypothetical protein